MHDGKEISDNSVTINGSHLHCMPIQLQVHIVTDPQGDQVGGFLQGFGMISLICILYICNNIL